MSGQLACYGIGARWARLRKFALPTPRYGQLAKICTGNLTGSGLRKYAHRQNHTIHGILRFYPPKSKTERAATRHTKTSEDYAGWRLRRGAGVARASQRRRRSRLRARSRAKTTTTTIRRMRPSSAFHAQRSRSGSRYPRPPIDGRIVTKVDS